MKAHQASSTARLIAAATIMREHQGDPSQAAPRDAALWCERFLSQSHLDRFIKLSVKSPAGRVWWRAVERLVLPGIVSHWMRRKQEIDRIARLAAEDGFTQLVVLGSGLDTLAHRLMHEGVFGSVISADHPATLVSVRRALNDAALRVPMLDLDLTTDDLPSVLLACSSFDPGRSTLFVIEGVLMYLPEHVVAKVFRSIASLPVPNARLLASWMLQIPGRPMGFHDQAMLVPRWLKQIGEPMLWESMPAKVERLLIETGWNATRLIDLSETNPDDANAVRGLASERLLVAESVIN